MQIVCFCMISEFPSDLASIVKGRWRSYYFRICGFQKSDSLALYQRDGILKANVRFQDCAWGYYTLYPRNSFLFFVLNCEWRNYASFPWKSLHRFYSG